MTQQRHIDVVEVAKILRRLLRGNFPETKFRVLSTRYCNGNSSIAVIWFEGPTRPEVKAITDRYVGATLNEQWDCYDPHTSLVAKPDGSIEEVQWGPDSITCYRETIEDRRERQDWERRESLGLNVAEWRDPNEPPF